MLAFIGAAYGKVYAENTRETIRRQVLHQFEQARIVDRNPDDPTLSTNSPRTHYALSRSAVAVLRVQGTPRFVKHAAAFVRRHGALLDAYRAARTHHLVPLEMPGGLRLLLSPGRHNELQAVIVQEFGPRFAPGGRVLYLGDAANKTLHIESQTLEWLGIPVTKHDKLPDVVLYLENRRWLFLIEAVTSHGPVSPKRRFELERVLRNCQLVRLYVSAFPDFREFKRHLTNIAWETEVWLAELPDHMIHYNGDKFLGPSARNRETKVRESLQPYQLFDDEA